MPRLKTATPDVLTILIVDRDRAAAEALAGAIVPLLPARPEIVAVDGGRTAADALRSGAFDVAALDLASLGDLAPTAEEAIARLVKLAADCLTIALSGEASVSAALAAMRAGAHDVIQKPVDGAEFTARVGALARRHGRTWSIAAEAETSPDLAAMLSNAGAALRSAAETPQRPPVLPMWQQEQRIIEDAIATFAGNITLAAQALELNPSTIYRKRQAWAEMESAAKGAA